MTIVMSCDAMLHPIIRGSARCGSNTWNSTAPAAAEKAKPEKPDTTEPMKTPDQSATSSFKVKP